MNSKLPKYKLTYKPYGAHSILIEWPNEIDENILNNALCFKRVIEKKEIKQKVYIKLSYSSLLITYNTAIRNIYDKISQLKTLYNIANDFSRSPIKLWHIPVCYDTSFGIDLERISTQNEISKQEIIRQHTASIYTVYFIGFLPGFLYLGGLNNRLHIPRLSTPRLAVEKGAVAIGGNQTGVYPNVSPGGWNIIGNTPISFFVPNTNPPCFAKSGDKIRFHSISKLEYDTIKALVKADTYQLESEVTFD
ncbi:MAG: 5-oxoprolinase subunit PxpB [Flavobacteriaceae bacterium]|nr:5-oxoprolinase subunit PxpB [Flavobacteriaceae bacterium]